MKDQGSISPNSKSTSTVEVFINEIYLEVSQDTECKKNDHKYHQGIQEENHNTDDYDKDNSEFENGIQ